MVKHSLDTTFNALADPTRRALLARLRRGNATVGAVARPFDMSLVAVSKHLRVLERAGLIEREVRGREHHCTLNGEPLRAVTGWTQEYLDFWENRLDALEAFVTREHSEEKNND